MVTAALLTAAALSGPSSPGYLPPEGVVLARMPADPGTIVAATASPWDFPSARTWTQAEKWRGLHPTFAARLRVLVVALRRLGWPAELETGWRPWSTQERFWREGRSHTTVSYHNFVDRQGRPAALAADIRADRSWPDRTKNRFYRDLRREAARAGLTSGGWWNGREETGADWHTLGWDPAHVELRLLPAEAMLAQMTQTYQERGLPIPHPPPGGHIAPTEAAARAKVASEELAPPSGGSGLGLAVLAAGAWVLWRRRATARPG